MDNYFCQAEGCINLACYFHFKGASKQKVCAEHMQPDKRIYQIQLFPLMDTEEDHQSAKDRFTQAEECEDYLNHLTAALAEEIEAARKTLETARLAVLRNVEKVFEVQRRIVEQYYEHSFAELDAAKRDLKKRVSCKDVALKDGLNSKQVRAGLLQLEVACIDLELVELLQNSFILETQCLPLVLAYSNAQLQGVSRRLYFQAASLYSSDNFLDIQRADFLCRASKRLSPFKSEYQLQGFLAKKLEKHLPARKQKLEELLSQEARIMSTVWEHLMEAPADAVTKYMKVIELSHSSNGAQACLEAANILRYTKESEALALCSRSLSLLLQHSPQSPLVKTVCQVFSQLHAAAGTSPLAVPRLKEVL